MAGPDGADADGGAPTGWRIWWAGARPRTLPAAVVPVLVGTACAAGVGQWPPLGDRGWFMYAPNSGVTFVPGVSDSATKGVIVARFVAAMIVALAIQVGTNFANDYSDGKRGTDDPGQRVGPPRLVGWGLASPGAVKRAALLSFLVAGVAGLYLAWAVTWWLIPVGLVCFAAGWLYTGGPKPYGYYGFGELFVFAFFGLVATIGSAFVQTESFSSYTFTRGSEVTSFGVPPSVFPMTLLAAVGVGLLATALLVTNNLRDIPSDTIAGKKTLAVRIGDGRTRVLYVAMLAGAFVAGAAASVVGGRYLGLLCLLAATLAVRPVQAVRGGAAGPDLIPVLADTGRVQLAFGVLLAAGLYIAA